MNRRNRVVLGLLLFNGISAVGGGIALMTGLIPEQASWVQHTDFASLYFPGVILMVGEIVSIRAFHFLQVIYFVTGAGVIWCTPQRKPVSDY